MKLSQIAENNLVFESQNFTDFVIGKSDNLICYTDNLGINYIAEGSKLYFADEYPYETLPKHVENKLIKIFN